MTAPAADPWCCRIVELAARMLPPEQRRRYALEFVAELYGMSKKQQFRHSTHVLAHAWPLRVVLRAAGPTTGPEATTRTATVPLRCHLRIHRWRWASAEDGGRYVTCLRCGRDKTDNVPGLAGKSTIGM